MLIKLTEFESGDTRYFGVHTIEKVKYFRSSVTELELSSGHAAFVEGSVADVMDAIENSAMPSVFY